MLFLLKLGERKMKKQTRSKCVFLLVAFCFSFIIVAINFDINIGYKSDAIERSTDLHHLPRSSGPNITIITPDNITYNSGMSGYYPSTYGFENDSQGQHPLGWASYDPDASCYIEIDNNVSGHNKVVEVHKSTSGSSNQVELQRWFTVNQTAGSFEFWIYKDTNSGTDGNMLGLYGPATSSALEFYIQDGNLYRGLYPSGTLIGAGVFSPNTWHYIRVDFNITQGGWQIKLDDTWYGSGYAYPFPGTPPTKFEYFYIRTHYSGCNPNYSAWLDAVSFSWDNNYNIGDNLNEGLLLSYINNTNLEWTGYSLDNQANITIYGNTTINMPSIGPHSIQVFGNTSGTMYESDIIYFNVGLEDTIPPIVVGNSSNLSIEQYVLANLEWNITEINNGTYNVWRNTTQVDSGPFIQWNNVSVPINTTIVGDWNYTIIATDPSGNNGTHTVIVHVIDTVKPYINISTSNYTIYQGDRTSFSWVITENNPANYTLHLNGILIESLKYLNNSDMSYGPFLNWTLGDLIFEIFANDTSGNEMMILLNISIIERIDDYIFLEPNVINFCDFQSEAGLFIESYSNSVMFLTIERAEANLAGLGLDATLIGHYFYNIKAYNETFNETSNMIQSMKIRFYFNPNDVDNPSNLKILHYLYDVGRKVWIWESIPVTLNTNEYYVEISVTSLSIFCLAEIKGELENPWLVFFTRYGIFIIFLSAIGISAPTIYIMRSKMQKAKLDKAKKLLELTEKAHEKKKSLQSKTFDAKLEIIAKPKIEAVPKKKIKQEIAQPVLTEAEEIKRADEIKKTEKEMVIEQKNDVCQVHKGLIKGITYVCPYCHTKYCLKCAKVLEEKAETCWVCQKPINISGEEHEKSLELDSIPQEVKSKDFIDNKAMIDYLEGENGTERFDILRTFEVTTVSKEFWEKLATLDWTEDTRKEFVLEMLSLPTVERMAILDEMIENDKKFKDKMNSEKE